MIFGHFLKHVQSLSMGISTTPTAYHALDERYLRDREFAGPR